MHYFSPRFYDRSGIDQSCNETITLAEQCFIFSPKVVFYVLLRHMTSCVTLWKYKCGLAGPTAKVNVYFLLAELIILCGSWGRNKQGSMKCQHRQCSSESSNWLH